MKVETSVSPALRVRVKAKFDGRYQEALKYITTGKMYDVIEDDGGIMFKIVDNSGQEDWYHKDWMEVVKEDIKQLPERNKYSREIKPGVYVDVYDVLRAFAVTDPSLQHLVKKALAVGQRGHKDAVTDLQDILDSAQRAVEMHKEWNDN